MTTDIENITTLSSMSHGDEDIVSSKGFVFCQFVAKSSLGMNNYSKCCM